MFFNVLRIIIILFSFSRHTTWPPEKLCDRARVRVRGRYFHRYTRRRRASRADAHRVIIIKIKSRDVTRVDTAKTPSRQTTHTHTRFDILCRQSWRWSVSREPVRLYGATPSESDRRRRFICFFSRVIISHASLCRYNNAPTVMRFK